VDFLSNWYVRRSRRRFWKSESDTDKLAAYQTLYKCLVTLSKLLAPFMPFLAEELYQNLVVKVYPDAPESVHLSDFPKADESLIDEQLSVDIRLAMKVSSLGRAAGR
jgi:isoleucyl-tRNA synthetase